MIIEIKFDTEDLLRASVKDGLAEYEAEKGRPAEAMEYIYDKYMERIHSTPMTEAELEASDDSTPPITEEMICRGLTDLESRIRIRRINKALARRNEK